MGNNDDAWKAIHAAARSEFPNPMEDIRRLKKGRAWGKKKIIQTPPSLESVMGSIYTHVESAKKAGSYQRVMDRAMEYHAVETRRRQAKYATRKKNPNRYDTLLVLVMVVMAVLACRWIPVLAGLR